jgi:hypothetical protein
MNRSKDTRRLDASALTLATVFYIGVIVIILLWGVATAQAASDVRPANREEALAIIAKADAHAQAEMLAALEKELTPLEHEWGIKFLSVNLTAAGYLVEFKYKILDPQKARGMVQRKFSPRPYVVVEKSGAILLVPFSAKLGSLRSSVRTANQMQIGKNYFTLFANPGRHVNAGDQITIVVGDFMVEHVVVR